MTGDKNNIPFVILSLFLLACDELELSFLSDETVRSFRLELSALQVFYLSGFCLKFYMHLT